MGLEHPEWLPVDWKVCVRVRSSGKKDKYYINPMDGLKFNSKLEVLRYLKNSEKDLKIKELNKMDIKKTVAENLPSGWIKEIRIKKKGGNTGRDLHYIDPVRGLQFRSMQEVFHYLETKDSGKAESKGDDQEQNSEELGDHSNSSTAGSEGQSLVDQKADQIFNGDESTQSGTEGAAVKNNNMPETKASEQREKVKITVAEDQKHETIARQNKRKKANSKWMNGLPRRTSKRLAGVEADPSLEVKTSNQARRAAILLGEAEVYNTQDIGTAGLPDKPEINTTGKFTASCEPNERVTTCRTENPANNKQNEPANLPVGDLSSLEEHEVVSVDSSLNDLLMDPCIEFAIKTLTGSIPIDDVNKVDDSPMCSLASPNQTSCPTSVLPSGVDIWGDPCIEFAVKMLTSEMPVEDGSHFQISFQQPSSGADGCSSLTLPNIRLDDNFHSSSYSFSQFENAMKPCVQKQGVRDPSLPHTMNSSL